MFVKVCRAPELKEGKPTKFRLDHVDVVIVKVGDRIFAMDAYCPHKGGNLEYGDVLCDGRCRIRCHLHYYEYDLCDGKLIPNIYSNKPGSWFRSPDLKVYDIKIVNDELFVNVD
ncbi:Rieske (2Fe-2S) domain protein [Metallosphaera sedula]|uniref:Rieske (2Fe-2S) domain protein n=3 Tax=Metallosphaera TaxID=41980 RepID=A4YG71_METS5|nr:MULTISPECIES: Rieske 2Fe-2S domain-containing protein [Metallosphaera]ABP95423.1 Rieske (2Fe-2S) domain protein [Metallosphaera sedula DSM 5348]AIM27408.1 Rieske (2Fe-2S) domain protein [Metallosphaera sedula]AKV74283.1 Rieske (2Fe-2S) protein [Metallosphaera sedula]AKV76522.1 Rieske (2Fe-2S) protein [Metallosphaera sedula]AKV78774.1 Rieske (2Fe-2S) protein [Metallosphaera sedula]